MPIPIPPPIAFVWVIGALIAGLFGRRRWIGFWGSFVISMLVSPLPVLAVLILTTPSKTRAKRQAS